MLKPFLSACCVVATFASPALQAQQPELAKLPAGMMLRLQFDVYVNFAALAPDGSILATAAGTKLTAWDTRTGKALWNEILCAPVGPRCLAFSPDGKTLAACGDFSVLRFFDPLTGKEPIVATSLPGRNDWWTLAYSPDGKHLVTAGVGHEGGGEGSVSSLPSHHTPAK